MTCNVLAADYAKDIAPLWKRNCIACHNSKKPEGGLNLETGALLLKGGDSGASVVAGKSAESEILKRITATDDTMMPPKDNSAGAKQLTKEEIELVKKWIDDGAVPGDSNDSMPISWQSIPGQFRPIYAIDCSQDGQFVACGRGNQVVLHAWPLTSNSAAATALIDSESMSKSGIPSAHLDLVQSIAFSPDGQFLATGGYRAVKLWRHDQSPSVLVGLKNTTGLTACDSQGKHIAIVREDRSIDIVDADARSIVRTIPALPATIVDLCWSPDNTALFVADDPKKCFTVQVTRRSSTRQRADQTRKLSSSETGQESDRCRERPCGTANR